MLRNSFSIIKYREFLAAVSGGPKPLATARRPDCYLYKEAKLCVKVNPDSSIPYVIPSIFVVNTLYIIIAKAEVPIPKAVLYKASEIPTDNSRAASPPPESPSLEKERIIPNTVPSNPNKVATDAIVDK